MNVPSSMPLQDVEGSMALALCGEEVLCDPSGALFLAAQSVLIVSDLHLEKGSSFARRGQLLPPYDTAATLDLLALVIRRFQPRMVISLGDSFHDGEASARLPGLYRAQLQQLMQKRDWYWVTGNHDPDSPTDLPGHSVQQLAMGALTFRHEPSAGEARGEVAGHLHPSAKIMQRGRGLRRPCFAHDGKRLIMPAFGAFTGSLNVLDKAFAGLFDEENLQVLLLGQSRLYGFARRHLQR